jgi:hypothetical protein
MTNAVSSQESRAMDGARSPTTQSNDSPWTYLGWMKKERQFGVNFLLVFNSVVFFCAD